MIIFIFIASLLGFMALGMPVAFALIACGLSMMLYMGATDPQIVAALDPILVEHRDRIFKAHFRDPMEF